LRYWSSRSNGFATLARAEAGQGGELAEPLLDPALEKAQNHLCSLKGTLVIRKLSYRDPKRSQRVYPVGGLETISLHWEGARRGAFGRSAD